jgi:hypothetical protein
MIPVFSYVTPSQRDPLTQRRIVTPHKVVILQIISFNQLRHELHDKLYTLAENP